MDFYSRSSFSTDEDSEVEVETQTSILQDETEYLVRKAIEEHMMQWARTGRSLQLSRNFHAAFLRHKLSSLPSSTQADSDTSQTMILYWIVHSMHLLGVQLNTMQKEAIIRLLASCQNSTGGFGGGPGQMSHLVTTYAAIACLCALKSDSALDIIDRKALYDWINSLRQRDGSFTLYQSGETDARGCYCALVVAFLTNIATEEMFSGTAEWIIKCQTYEGGFGGNPESEAHIGYSFCALASMSLLKQTDRLDLDALVEWTVSRQMQTEGGFQGRTNKLVDSSYSYWAGAILLIIDNICDQPPDASNTTTSKINTLDLFSERKGQPLFAPFTLQKFLLAGCQRNPSTLTNICVTSLQGGGFSIRPGQAPDLYRTCLSLAGLGMAQLYAPAENVDDEAVVWGEANRVKPNDILYNIDEEAVQFARDTFDQHVLEL